jgi:hypothetical protein
MSPQRAPQLPQCSGDELTSTHASPQRSKGAAQISSHLPLLHAAVPFNSEGHDALQPPQCCTSRVVSTQAALQLSMPGAQESLHWPDEQTLPAGQ